MLKQMAEAAAKDRNGGKPARASTKRFMRAVEAGGKQR
jgi:hypothetical protein